MAEAKVSVRSDLGKIADDLKKITQTAAETGSALSQATGEVGKQVSDQTSLIQGGLNKLRAFSKTVAGQIKDDFRTLFSVGAMASGLKLSQQFGGAVKEAVNLSDTIRNLSPIFGIAQDRSEKFKRSLVSGLAEIGVGADAAANALQGLSQTGVRGEKNLVDYSRVSGELAGVSKQKGQEGSIAKGLAGVVVAQGGDVNDTKAMQKVADNVLRIRNATGKSATEALDMLNKLFSSANTDFKKRLGAGGGVSLAAAGLMGGEGSTGFLERYMGMDDKRRAGYDAQGMGRLIGKDGSLNQDAFQSTVGEAKRRGGGNAEFGLTTMGMSEDEAKGFLRLADAMKVNGAAIDRARSQVVDLNKEYTATMGMGDAFRANINRVKSTVVGIADKAGLPTDLIGKGTDALAGASKSDVGSGAVVAGGAILAAMLTSKGLKGIGGGLLGGELKSKAIEGITGEKVQRVEVINWPTSMEGAWSSWGGAAKGAGGIAGGAAAAGETAAGVGLSTGVGIAGATVAAAFGLSEITGAIVKALTGADLKNAGGLVGGMARNGNPDAENTTVRVVVESKAKDFKATRGGARGSGQ